MVRRRKESEKRWEVRRGSRKKVERGVCCFFFFQAEDGIRDWSVTGVQTCALPISPMRTEIFALAYRFDMLSRSALGSCCVRPSAGPRGMMVTL